MSMDLREKAKQLPDQPGVYQMKDADGALLYVGKAASLRKRVSSYFQSSRRVSPRTEAFLSRVADVEYIATRTEAEALLYEASLIRERQPRYNVLFRDDKRYPMLKLTVNERWPRLAIVRRRFNDGALYFGPYADARLLRQAVKLVRRIFPLRACHPMPTKTCLDYHLGLCAAPCIGNITEAAYQQTIRDMTLFLNGRRDELLDDLARRMEAASQAQRYEEAARLRDMVQALGAMAAAPEIVSVSAQAARQLGDLMEALRLETLPRRIEAFDISNIHGKQPTGSMVCFVDGLPSRADYRTFHVRDIEGIDDYRMMGQVVQRRYRRALEERQPLPDLVLIDGGKGHVHVARETLRGLGLERLPVIGLAKRLEQVIVPDRPEPIELPRDSRALHLLQRIRDEAHRFAIGHHRRRRGKAALDSALDAIPGIGPVRRRRLITRFGSVDGILQASAEEIATCPGISLPLAVRIGEYLRGL